MTTKASNDFCLGSIVHKSQHKSIYLNIFAEVKSQKNYALGKPAWQSSLYDSGKYSNNLFTEMA